MTTFKDRLPATIRLQKRFSPSPDRVRHAANLATAIFVIALGMWLLSLLLGWLES